MASQESRPIRVALVAPPQAPIDEFAICRAQPPSSMEQLAGLRQDIFSGFDRQVPEHLGIGCIAACLRQQGCEVRVIDAAAESLGVLGATEILRRFDPLWIGISVSSLLQISGSAQLCNALREKGVAAHISLGGAVATVNFAALLQSIPGLDSVIVNEGEGPAGALVKELARGGSGRGLPGVARRDGGQILFAAAEHCPDLDRIPFPDRDGLDAWRRRGQSPSVLSLFSSRTCLAGCRSCNRNGETGRPRYRAPEPMAAELGELISRYGATRFHYVDPEFFGADAGDDRVPRFADAVIRAGHVVVIGAASHVRHIRRDDLGRMKQAGLARIALHLGTPFELETDPREELRRCAEISRAVSLCRSAGIEIEPTMSLITERTRREQIARNLEVIRAHGLHKCRQPFALLNAMEFVPSGNVLDFLKCNLADGEFKPGPAFAFADPGMELCWNQLRAACVQLHERDRGQLPLVAHRLWRTARTGNASENRALLDRFRRWKANIGELFLALVSAAIERPWEGLHADELAARLQQTIDAYDYRYLASTYHEALGMARKHAATR